MIDSLGSKMLHVDTAWHLLIKHLNGTGQLPTITLCKPTSHSHPPLWLLSSSSVPYCIFTNLEFKLLRQASWTQFSILVKLCLAEECQEASPIGCWEVGGLFNLP